ncbi:hypothetical protein [[Mycobacterium] wendilense]|uniref:Uncharacterized protein n=1 Tax=[Mycobacterium] wendilense TaxID=3064284 RepID=A0ABM9MIK0_9MYCO|nr:hypothetical protein [Mycolicibacterium sp. MU0050]CAJ1586048.1 hypothetical protein MU0050_004059 [Mycolicibacterium sp. MU0050]
MPERDDMSGPAARLSQDDWVDQDLLTQSLAAALLDDEIAAERDRIQRYDSGGQVPEALLDRVGMQRRLVAMETLRDSLRRQGR